MKCRNCGAINDDHANFCRVCGHKEFESTTPSSMNRSNKSLQTFLIAILVLLIAVVGIFAYIVFLDTSPVEVTQFTSANSGNVMANSNLASNIANSDINSQITTMTNAGVPLIKIGDGSGPVSVITAGVHGDQLVPCVAAMDMINYLNGRKIKGTVYIIPFTSPQAVSQNTKLTNGVNLNQAADDSGSVTYDIVQFAHNNNATAVGDFHETEVGKNPGVTTIMCSQVPTAASYQLANDMSSLTLDTKLSYLVAGIAYDGAVEDELNLLGTPAVTPLVQVQNHGTVTQSAVNESFNQMLALLIANGNLDPNDGYLKLANLEIDGL